MAGLDLADQGVDHAAQGLNLHGLVAVKGGVGADGALHHILHGAAENDLLLLTLGGKDDVLGVHLLCGLRHFHSVVADTLDVGDGVEEGIEAAVILHRQVLGRELEEVSAQHILKAVGLVLKGDDLVVSLLVEVLRQLHGIVHGIGGVAAHLGSHGVCLLHGHGGGSQQTLIQQHRCLMDRLGGDEEVSQLHQEAVHRHQHGRCAHVEEGVDHGDVPCLGGLRQEGPVDEDAETVEDHGEEAHAHHVEEEVDKGGAPCVAVSADSAHHGGDTRTDVLTQDDGERCAEGHRAGGAQALQNTDRSGGGLDQRRQQCAEDNAENGVGEGDHQLGKPRLVLQEGHGIAHDVHTGHQSEETQCDDADALFLIALGEHKEGGADDTHQGGEGRGLEQLHDEAAALQAGEGEDPGGHGGTDVGAHDDAHGLLQRHDAGVDEAHHHDGGCRGGLDDGGDRHAKQEALENIGAHFGQDGLQLTAGLTLQCLAHGVHTEEEQCKAAQQGYDVKKVCCHLFCLPHNNKISANSVYLHHKIVFVKLQEKF